MKPILTKEQVEQIRNRADAASPGPWEAKMICCPEAGYEFPTYILGPEDKDGYRVRVLHPSDLNEEEEDGQTPSRLILGGSKDTVDFILAARVDVPALIASHERLRGKLCPTADDGAVGYDGTVYALLPDGSLRRCSVDVGSHGNLYAFGDGGGEFEICQCYSTREAAEAAKEKA